MSEETEKFIAAMLKSAKEKKDVEPQTRFEGVDKKEVQDIVAEIQGFKKKKEE